MRETYKTIASLQTGKISPAQFFELKPVALGLHRKNVLRQTVVNCGRPPVSGIYDEPYIPDRIILGAPLGTAAACARCFAFVFFVVAGSIIGVVCLLAFVAYLLWKFLR